MHDFLMSDEFSQYQKKLIRHLAKSCIKPLMDTGNYTEMKGAIRAIKRMIHLPYELSGDKRVEEKIHENWARFQSEFIREAVEGIDE